MCVKFKGMYRLWRAAERPVHFFYCNSSLWTVQSDILTLSHTKGSMAEFSRPLSNLHTNLFLPEAHTP